MMQMGGNMPTTQDKPKRRTKAQIAEDEANQADGDDGVNRLPPDGTEGDDPPESDPDLGAQTDPTMPIGGGRSSSGREPQTSMDEVILNAEDNLDLIGYIEEMEANAAAHKTHDQAKRNRDRALEKLGVKGGPHMAYRLRDFRIVYIPGEGDAKHVEMDRAPISKLHVDRITTE
jgi:hypothetical protein